MLQQKHVFGVVGGMGGGGAGLGWGTVARCGVFVSVIAFDEAEDERGFPDGGVANEHHLECERYMCTLERYLRFDLEEGYSSIML